MLVLNHASFLDPPLVGCSTPRMCYFLARESLARIPLFGRYLRAIGVHFVDRDGSARAGLARAIEALQAGEVLCMFPEGTRTRTGELAEFRPGALLILRRAPVPVVPVGVRGTFLAWPRTRRLPRPGRCSVHFGAPMSAQEVLAPGGFDELRRRVAELAGVTRARRTRAQSIGPRTGGMNPRASPRGRFRPITFDNPLSTTHFDPLTGSR